jgi:hypothetical protein
MVIPSIQKLLPVFNFIITSTALDFQVSILHPWHHQLDQDLNHLHREQEMKLDEYEELRMEHIKNIEQYLVKLNID